MEKYVLFVPKGGFNDILCCLERNINYCRTYNRTLLFAMNQSCYSIELGDYFDIENIGINIIYDTAQIKTRLLNKTIYHLDIELNDVIDGKITFQYIAGSVFYSYKDILCSLPEYVVDQDVILSVQVGGGRGFNIFKYFQWKDSLKELCRTKRKLLPDHYLCIQVRCTDYQCDYIQLYEDNHSLIHSYPAIYLATDNEDVVHYFRSKGLNLYCFTTFPPTTCRNLHNSKIHPHTLFCGVFVDLWMAVNSDQILSNSKGGFIKLLRDCFNNKLKFA